MSVADADFATAALCSAYFSDVDYYVDTAVDGLDCLAKLRRTAPDLLVLDQNLLWGGSQGLLVCLREEYQEPRIPVVLLAQFLPVGALSVAVASGGSMLSETISDCGLA